MFTKIFVTILAGLSVFTSPFIHKEPATTTTVLIQVHDTAQPEVSSEHTVDNATNKPTSVLVNVQAVDHSSTNSMPKMVRIQSVGAKVYSDSELLTMADNKFADGNVPLGDNKYVTTVAKKGYVYLCNVRKDNPGSMVNGPWMGTDTWNFLQKISIQGAVNWPNATFTDMLSKNSRTLSGNDLPIKGTTGVFPVAASDPAHNYDPNPNTISAQKLMASLPKDPTYSETPYCMGGEVGIMTNGIALFNAFDAGLRDAPAHELQDSCNGHPQGSGEYHYHSQSSCMKDSTVKTVLGFAYDGFPITGSKVSGNKYLTTEDLDECHGLSSEVILDGVPTKTYHYVMTADFPYTASCFRGKPISTGPSVTGGVSNGQGMQSGGMQNGGMQNQGGQTGNNISPNDMPNGGMNPPQEAISACNGKSQGNTCSILTPQGALTGTCRTPPNSVLACVPNF